MFSQEKLVINQNYLTHVFGKNAKIAPSCCGSANSQQNYLFWTDPDMNVYTLYYCINSLDGYRCGHEQKQHLP